MYLHIPTQAKQRTNTSFSDVWLFETEEVVEHVLSQPDNTLGDLRTHCRTLDKSRN